MSKKTNKYKPLTYIALPFQMIDGLSQDSVVNHRITTFGELPQTLSTMFG